VAEWEPRGTSCHVKGGTGGRLCADMWGGGWAVELEREALTTESGAMLVTYYLLVRRRMSRATT
jgi:hypothetical protein